MDNQELNLLLEELNQAKDLAFSNEVPDAPALSGIVNRLNSIDQKHKIYFKEFATSLKEDLFSKGVTIKGLNLDQFDNLPVENQTISNEQETRLNVVQVEFDELFNDVVNCLKEHLEILKGYFLFKLANNPLDSYQLLVLYDESFFIQPIKKKISCTIADATFKPIQDLHEEITTGRTSQSNLLCLLLLLPRTNNEDSIKQLNNKLEGIIESFDVFEHFSFKNNVDTRGRNYESSISKEDFQEEVEYVCGTLLSNGAIKHEEEKIIKKLFSSFQTPLLIYKTLKSGNSGSKVIEIRPKKEWGNEYEKRYIIKYGEKTIERKIHKESKCFGKWIGGYKGFKEYECEYAKTLTHEGIRYSYAISDSASESYSYSDILNDSNNGFHTDKVEIIDSLFSIELYRTWLDSLDSIECQIKNLYSPYIKPESVFKQVSKILNLEEGQLDENELFINFTKIWEHSLEVNKKVCHGDLHSENFFKDKNGIYLIDFGFTDMRHALIDHTSLECSLKFKHVPFYIELSELIAIEEELVLDSSFKISAKFTRSKRADLNEILEIIKRIRCNSFPLWRNQNSPHEYLVSLFLMTFRQIKYPDLNQLYAYHSAVLLSNRIVQILYLK